MKHFIAVFLLSFLSTIAFSQTVNQNSGWLFILNSTKFSDKWGMHLDVQFRSSQQWENLRNFLFRPGITYYINEKSNVTAGYLLTNTFLHLNGAADNSLTEHRIWEQYILNHKLGAFNVSHRFRVEQRFMETSGADEIFSQRLRYFFRFLLPVFNKEKESFTNGPFVALQNEVFLNIQNKDQLNKNIFDQNRAYVAAGYRFNKSIDIEAGYLNQALKGAENNTLNHVIQLAVYTRF